ncbi:MAG: hypothetical protein ACREEK_18975 [Bradyrhizobium sp.]
MVNSSRRSNAARSSLVADVDNLNERAKAARLSLVSISSALRSQWRLREQNCPSRLVMELQHGEASEDGKMRAIDRVMAAYSRTHQLTEEQARLVRQELSAFIEELLAGKNLNERDWPVKPERAAP